MLRNPPVSAVNFGVTVIYESYRQTAAGLFLKIATRCREQARAGCFRRGEKNGKIYRT